MSGALSSVIAYFTGYGAAKTKVGTLVLDLLVTEEIDLQADVSLYPVETGSLITDNVTWGVEKLRIAGLVSTADVTAFSFSNVFGTKIVDAVESLRAMHKARALVEISTGQMVYTDFAFTSLSATRSNGAQGGNWLEIKAELIKVRKVVLRQAEVPAENAAPPAAGRAGQTNQAAGRSAPTSTGTGTGTGTPAAAGTPANVSPAMGIYNNAAPAVRAQIARILPSFAR